MIIKKACPLCHSDIGSGTYAHNRIVNKGYCCTNPICPYGILTINKHIDILLVDTKLACITINNVSYVSCCTMEITLNYN